MSTIQRLIYIANVRLPTEKAHRYQICQMCEALTHNGVTVRLLHPHRFQVNPVLRGRSMFDYYDLPQVFEVRTLANFDIVRMERLFLKGTFTPLFFAHTLLWGLYATLRACGERADLHYTRELRLLIG